MVKIPIQAWKTQEFRDLYFKSDDMKIRWFPSSFIYTFLRSFFGIS